MLGLHTTPADGHQPAVGPRRQLGQDDVGAQPVLRVHGRNGDPSRRLPPSTDDRTQADLVRVSRRIGAWPTA